ncbi:MAG: MotA/TolQ/ExbB proton channel family protein [Bacteroidetes bacterium]|nr:MotA/TolQ/ExbB proton channel family protein [Bacteroidota bacterium]
MKDIFEIFPYGLLVGWFIFSIYYLIKAKRTPDKINPYIFDSIPQVFPTIGILGTFLGIAYGLFYFDVDNMTESIPELLNGLKTAFIASIFGIIGLLIFSKLTAIVQRGNDKGKTITSDEVSALNLLIDHTKKAAAENASNFKILNTSLVGETDESLATQFAKLKNQMQEQTDKLSKIQTALGGDSETSLLTQIQKLRAEQNEYSKLTSTNSTFIVETMNKNNEMLRTKFDEFTLLLTENNTKALVEAMERVITDFNTQMNELIQKLVKENFEELNNSVKNLNDWQKENKVQIEILIDQFNNVTSNIEKTSRNIQEISVNTKSLTDDNSVLVKMIVELQTVLVEDRKFTEAIEKLHKATTNVESSSNQLADYMKKEKGFQESINQLLEKLKEIEKIKDTNKEFWKDIELKMKEGVNIIAEGNKKLANDVNKLDSEFMKRLSDSFMSLDKVLQAMVMDYQKKTNEVINEIKR